MQAAKQQALSTITKLPDNVTFDEIISILARFKNAPPKLTQHPVDRCFGALGKGRRTDAIIAGIRDER
uniref:Uncharacterized protein n=1 Tax=Candidatus Kentrum sp. FM TaxID=2126340 RepID=A0A450WD72_9GAMM|nr:MAG: hypothetical protein BECKFM1743A_GA0114220_103453 [Candidatus Kentron sp. FM]VFJ64428.1 MAG: hypothetical protein BECKFM1743C_GA0114222_103683 [Candidatus Kentron sp. FM]VFK15026.1 MAG: hypothetical protein BECKFM1743B_GA0114221_103503 [Candidatus Kentron sp. FM]